MCASGNSAHKNARNTRVQEYKDVKRGNRKYGNTTLTSMCGSSSGTGADDTLRKYDQTKIQEPKRLLALLNQQCWYQVQLAVITTSQLFGFSPDHKVGGVIEQRVRLHYVSHGSQSLHSLWDVSSDYYLIIDRLTSICWWSHYAENSLIIGSQ